MITQKRDYEVSIWSLQDEFIFVLKPSGIEKKGMIENKKFDLFGSESINKYEFSIPMYIYENGQRIENPIWFNTINGNLISNMRKVKVILNKLTSDEAIYEFLIIDVSERHEKDQLYCDVICEDLAYHELGKIGYKISLSEQTLLDETNEWFDNNGSAASEPRGTIQYWNDKFLTNIIGVNNPKPQTWYYSVQMNWSSYENGANRSTSKIYEESFVSSWNVSQNRLVPSSVESYKEKERLIDIEESNIFNITQKIAETFGVFVKYQYLYDNYYHIVGRRIIYYNNFVAEENGYLGITYPFSASKIVRKNDSQNVTTKMYVRNIETEATDSGVISIMDVNANRSQEDYLLNFDYMRSIGAISDEQYAEIDSYEAAMRNYNLTAKELEATIFTLSEELPNAKAALANASASIPLAQSELSKAHDLLNSLGKTDGVIDTDIEIDPNNPEIGILIPNMKAGDGTYYINISVQGIYPESIHIYQTFTIGQQNPLSNEVTFTMEYDEFDGVVKLVNIPAAAASIKTMVYMTYKYQPKLYYDKVIAIWTKKLQLSIADEAYYTNRVNTLETQLVTAQSQYNSVLASKKARIKKFEEMMGAALRESYWQPEDTYQDCGEKIVDYYSLSMTSNTASYGNSGHSYMFWDNDLFDDEQKLYYSTGVSLDRNNYPCVILSNKFLSAFGNQLDRVSFMYYDYTAEQGTPRNIKTIRNFPIQSQCQLGYAKVGQQILPVLILTFAKTLTSTQLGFLTNTENSPQLGILETSVSSNNVSISVENAVPVLSTDWLNFSNSPVAVYPRICIDSLSIFKNSDNLNVRLSGNMIEQYADYYLLTKVDGKTYITIKPINLIKLNVSTSSISCFFTLSNANTAIYLDAIEVLKENAYPKVSYTIDPNVFSQDFLYTIYNNLNRIVNINDNDLKLKNVQGYIFSISINLDKPSEDKIEIKNYKNEFEDLFSSIVAETQVVEKNGYAIALASRGFTTSGALTPKVIQRSMLKADLDYYFNNGTLTINEEEGIWGTSDSGVVAFRGGGIFTATQKDEAGKWIWNTGIIPQGINADLITTGQLDTNKIMVYAGDKLRFQLNGEGLFAYKSFFEDLDKMTGVQSDISAATITQVNARLAEGKDIDSAQFVKMDMNGLTLIAKPGAMVMSKHKVGSQEKYVYHVIPAADTATARVDDLGYNFHIVNSAGGQIYNEDGTMCYNTSGAGPYYYYDDEGNFVETPEGMRFYTQSYGTYTIPSEGIKRVSISWDGLSLRNYQNEEVFYADANTGNLYLKGRLYEDGTYVNQAGVGLIPLKNYVGSIAEKHMGISEKLKELFDKAGEILIAASTSLTDLNNVIMEDFEILNDFKEDVAEKMTPKVTRGPYHPAKFKPGDVWEKAPSSSSTDAQVEGVYVAVVYWDEVYDNETAASTTAARESEDGWTRTADYSLAAIKGANMKIDTEGGTIDILAQKEITINSAGKINLGANKDVNIIGNENVNLGGANINITSADSSLAKLGGIHFVATKYDNTALSNNTGTISGAGSGTSRVDITGEGIEMATKNGINIKAGGGISIKSATSDAVAVLELDNTKGIWLGSDKGIHIFSGATNASGQNESGADVVLNSDRLMLGVVNVAGNQGTVVDITDEYFIVGSANNISDLQTDDIALSDNSGLTGLKITKDGFGFATGTGSNRSVVIIDDQGIMLGAGTTPVLDGSYIAIMPEIISIGTSSDLELFANNVRIQTNATAGNPVFAIGTNLSENNPTYYLRYDTVNGFRTGGWTVDSSKLYSSSVGLDSSDTYAIWAGASTGASAPFSVQRDGTVVLTDIKVKNDSGTYTTITNYPFWKLNTNFIRSASVSGNTLTLTYFDGNEVNFNKAATFNYRWNGGQSGYTFEAQEVGVDGAQWLALETLTPSPVGTGTSSVLDNFGSDHKLGITVGVTRQPGLLFQWIVDATDEYNAGADSIVGTWDRQWDNNQTVVRIPSKTDGTSRDITITAPIIPNDFYLYNDGSWNNGQYMVRAYDSNTHMAISGKNWPVSAPIATYANSQQYISSGKLLSIDLTVGGDPQTISVPANDAFNAGADSIVGTWNGQWDGNNQATVEIPPKTDGTVRNVIITAPTVPNDFYLDHDGSWSNGIYKVRAYDSNTHAAISGKLYNVELTDNDATWIAPYYKPNGDYDLEIRVGGKQFKDTFTPTDAYNTGADSIIGTWDGTWDENHQATIVIPPKTDGTIRSFKITAPSSSSNFYLSNDGGWSNGIYKVRAYDSNTHAAISGQLYNVEITNNDASWIAPYYKPNGDYDLEIRVGGKQFTDTFTPTAAYNAGRDYVTATWNGNWDRGTATVAVTSTSNGTSRDVPVSMPTNEDSFTEEFRSGSSAIYDITCTVGGKSYTDFLMASEAYTNGWDAVDFTDTGSWSNKQRTIKIDDTMDGTTRAITISAPGLRSSQPITHSYDSINNTYDITIHYAGGGTDTDSFGASTAWNNGWINGYNAAVTASGRDGSTVTFPTTTSTTSSTPTTSETAYPYGDVSITITQSQAQALGISAGTYYKDLHVGWRS